jgi:hypothetical protein
MIFLWLMQMVYIVAAMLRRDNVLYKSTIFQCMGNVLAHVFIVYTAMFGDSLCPGR